MPAVYCRAMLDYLPLLDMLITCDTCRCRFHAFHLRLLMFIADVANAAMPHACARC